ncbi:hypothetical protein ABZW11_24205 [Nonomuraea sp. NPDC004580]
MLALIRAEPENAPSIAVAQRSGFRYVRRSQDEDGTWYDYYFRGL